MGRLSPQEKKALSYAKDRRNSYYGNDKASRRLIPKGKAQVNRIYRRSVREILATARGQNIEGADILESRAKDIKKTDWSKVPDTPLGEIVERKLKYRMDHAGHGKTARKKTADFLRTLKVEARHEPNGSWKAKANGIEDLCAWGETREAAIRRCKSIAQAVFMQSLGALEILDINDKFISVLSR